MRQPLRLVAVLCLLAGWLPSLRAENPKQPGDAAAVDALTLVVTDPLAAPLSCPCVEGYAQRKYERLAAFLEKQTGRPVHLVFGETLAKALEGKAKGKVDLVIGKDSVVRAEGTKAGFKVVPLARLTGKDGKTTQTGLIVVPTADPAQKAADLNGYRIIFGTAECDEKHAAPIQLLKAASVALPTKLEMSVACSDGACCILELGAEVRGAAVISSYARPLLEGCGTIKKGDLRIVGETRPVPFIAAFATNTLSARDREAVEAALLAVGDDLELCEAIESLIGFVPLAEEQTSGQAPAAPNTAAKKN
jgi:ABC-type phosphate/phosphonate transport system substrate-binding protein